MIGVLLMSLSTLLSEVSSCIGKKEMKEHKETVYSMGFLNVFFIFFFFAITLVFFTNDYRFSIESLPFFALRLVLEIILIHITLKAIQLADRSTFNFIRLLTIPGIFAMDVILGYSLTITEIIGVLIIIFTLLSVAANHKFGKKGAHLAGASGLLAVFTVSLYKYNITHYNSVEIEQIMMTSIMLIYLFFGATFITKERPIAMLKKGIFFTQSMAHGLAGVIAGFAFMFAPASVIMATSRATSVLWSIVSGNMYFHERHVVSKIIFFLLILCGLIFFVL